MSDVAKSGESEGHIEKIIEGHLPALTFEARVSDGESLDNLIEEAGRLIDSLENYVREETHKARIEELDGVLLASQTLDSSSGILDAVDRRIAELKGAGEPIQNRTWSNTEGRFL